MEDSQMNQTSFCCLTQVCFSCPKPWLCKSIFFALWKLVFFTIGGLCLFKWISMPRLVLSNRMFALTWNENREWVDWNDDFRVADEKESLFIPQKINSQYWFKLSTENILLCGSCCNGGQILYFDVHSSGQRRGWAHFVNDKWVASEDLDF